MWKGLTENRRVRDLKVEADRVQVLFVHGPGQVKVTVTYRLRTDGKLMVTTDFDPVKDDLPDPLRVGLRFDTDPALANLEWYGRGPQESYVDRQTGYAIGRYKGTVAEQFHDYARPQETGNKNDVRWIALSDPSGQGVKVTGAQPLSANALAFPYEDLYARPRGERRSADITPHGEGTLLIDLAQIGVGGDTGWSLEARSLVKYRIPLKAQSYSFTIETLAP